MTNRSNRWQLIRLFAFVLVLATAVLVPCVLSQPGELQAQIGEMPQPALATVNFEYPTIKIYRNSDFLRVATGSVTYYFYDNGADRIYDSDGSYVGTSKWRLFADTLSLDLTGKVSYELRDSYHILVTRTIPLSKLDGSVIVTYDITGERTKTSITVEAGNILVAVKSLKLGWINNVNKSAIAEESLQDGAVRYDLNNGKYLSMNWHDVQDSLGDIGTLNISSLSTTKEAEIIFELGALGKLASVTLDPTQEYTSAGSYTWTCPAGVSLVTAETWGGGGGGGASTGTSGGGGGGGGGYSKKNNISVTPTIDYSVVVGVAGASPSGAGGDSSFGNSTPKECLAKGGVGGNGNGGAGGAGGASASGVGDTKYSGGKGGDSGYLLDGGGGEGACTTSNGNAGTSALPGIGGSGCDGGNGGNGRAGSNQNQPGVAPGGGGGGDLNYGSSPSGAIGGVGKVKLTYYYAPECVTDGTESMTHNSCTLKGNITDDGGETPTYYKFEWDTDSGAPYANSYTSAEGSYPEGAYSRAISSLNAGTLYYWRFSASNPSAGWGYSTESTFLTRPLKPTGLGDTKTSTTIALTWTKGTGAEKTMIRYSDSAYPTTVAEGTQAYFDTGSGVTIEDLEQNTLYYISFWSYVDEGVLEQYSVDYATRSVYTRPDDVLTLTCSNPSVDTIDLDWSSTTGADQYKVIRKVGGIPESITDGVSIYFGVALETTATGLSPNQLYGFGVWGYGNSSTLYSSNPATCSETTLVDAPVITNSYGASSVGETYATLNGEVSYTGGENPTCYFYWGDEDGGTNPLDWDNQENMGVQGGSFSKNLITLIEGTTYYYRTYGTNSGGEDWADSSAEFTCGCLDPGQLTVTKEGDYKYHLQWEGVMPISTVTMGIDTAPTSPHDGTFIYKGNSTDLYYYADLNCVDGEVIFRVWSDCTSCLTCSQYAYSDNYSEDSVILSGNCTGGGGMGSLTIVTDSGNATSVDGVIQMLGLGTISTIGGNNTVEISGTTFLSLPDTPSSYAGQGGLYVAVNEEETALEFVTGNITGPGSGNITFVTMSGNATSIDGVITMDGIDIETSGTEGTVSFAIGGENVEEIGIAMTSIAEYAKLGMMLGLALLLGLLGVKRHSLTLYLCGIFGFGIALWQAGDILGQVAVIPLFILIVGLLGALVRDGLNRDLIII